jgi:hypothetical protein
LQHNHSLCNLLIFLFLLYLLFPSIFFVIFFPNVFHIFPELKTCFCSLKRTNHNYIRCNFLFEVYLTTLKLAQNSRMKDG